jgi:soluble lytic murein transglycosylase-like protein
MKFASIALILLGSGFVYDLAIPKPAHIKLPEVTSKIRFFLPKVSGNVDTHALIRKAAAKHKVPAAFVKSIVAAESNFNCNALSDKGAVGLMQLMPATAMEYGADPTIPEQNIDAGTRYLGVLLKRYAKYKNCTKRAIAAYNAGPGAVDRYKGVPPYKETRGYVTRVLAFMRQYEKD